MLYDWRSRLARINSQVALLGEVRYNGDRTVQVVPRLAGLVEAVPVSAGDRVRRGGFWPCFQARR